MIFEAAIIFLGTLFIISILRAEKEYWEMQSHINAVIWLTRWAPMYGLEWMENESVPGFRRRMLQKLELPKTPCTPKEIIERLAIHDIRNCRLIQEKPGLLVILVNPKYVGRVEQIAYNEFAAWVQYDVRPLPVNEL